MFVLWAGGVVRHPGFSLYKKTPEEEFLLAFSFLRGHFGRLSVPLSDLSLP